MKLSFLKLLIAEQLRDLMNKILDVLGIGFGPANIALAALLEEEGFFPNALFLERSNNPVWQKEMLFENAMDIHSNIQNIPHRDLATLRSPRSKYTFMNYLHATGLLTEHLNMDLMLPMRPDFAAYINWVREQLTGYSQAGCEVNSIEMLGSSKGNRYQVKTTNGETFLSRHLIVGTGRQPFVPAVFRECDQSDRVFHASSYNSSMKALLRKGIKKVAVVGSSQSAAELLLHLSKIEPRLEIHSIMRRFAFPLKDTSPFMSEVYFPEFVDMYYNADPQLKKRISNDVVRTNYGACDHDVLDELYRQIYYDRLHGKNKLRINSLTDIVSANETNEHVQLMLKDARTGQIKTETYDGIILATGFMNIGPEANAIKIPSFLEPIADRLDLDRNGVVQVDRAYRVKLRPEYDDFGAIVLNGMCENTHGMGDAGSLSLLALRAQTIVNALLEQADSCAPALKKNAGLQLAIQG